MNNANITRMSALYAPTLKEDPTDAEIASHKLLLRAGFIRKTAAGIYTFLPLGKRVLTKIENIVREEMDACGAQEIRMPMLQPEELWQESGRADAYGPERMRLNDRHDHEFCLGPTHEELITALVRAELRSYKQLRLNMYQIQTKFRDEIRPRFGLLRSREFVMKDGYSFHDTQESLQEEYDRMYAAYERICARCGLEFRPVQADAGQIGGAVTCEFHALAEAGESALVYCDCGYAASDEVGEGLARPTVYDVPEMEKVATPGVHTIAELAEFLGIPESSTVKALSGKNDEGKLVVLFVPGDHEVNEEKAARAAGGFTILTDEDMESYGLHKGSMGPVSLPEDAFVIAANSLKAVPKWVVGANEDGFHYLNANLGRDFSVTHFADLRTVQEGEISPDGKGRLKFTRGIEIGHIFKLGTRYSKDLDAVVLDENGRQLPIIMGCYGIGVSRLLSAIVEQHSDENGIVWPRSIAPFDVHVIPVNLKKEEQVELSEKVTELLENAGYKVLVDDRKERPGVKFADSDLIGIPARITVGKKAAEGIVEIKLRRTGETLEVKLDELLNSLQILLKEESLAK